MAITITAGHQFATNEIANAGTLNDLVQHATISGLTAADISGSILGISVFSGASGASPGSVSYEYQPDQTLLGGPYALPMYLITQFTGAKVALFSPYGLETRRFVNRNENNLVPGTAFLIRLGEGANVTLSCTVGYAIGVPRHDFLGSSYGTTSSSPTDPSNTPRLTIRGPCPANVVDAGDTIRKFYYLLNAVTGQWQHSPSATNTDKVAALALRPNDSGGNTFPMFLFGAPVWRSP